MPSPSDRFAPEHTSRIEEETDLIRRSQKGDQRAFAEIVRRYQPRVFAIIAHLVRASSDVEDLAQQVFVKLYLALPTFRFRSALGTFLYRIAVNECYDYLRRRRAREPREAMLNEEQAARLERLEDEQAAQRLTEPERLELKESVMKLLARATPEERILLTLREVEGFSIREIADIMDMNENTVKVKLFRAREKLARLAGDPPLRDRR